MNKLTSRQKKIADLILTDGTIAYPPSDHSGNVKDYLTAFDWHNSMDVRMAFKPGSDAFTAVESLIPPENVKIARRLWERSVDYPYPVNFDDSFGQHLAFRSQTIGSLYIINNLRILRSYINSIRNGFGHMDLLGSRDFALLPFYVWLAALILDESVESAQFFAVIKDSMRTSISLTMCFANVLLSTHQVDMHTYLTQELPKYSESIRFNILRDAINGTWNGLQSIAKIDYGLLTVDYSVCRWAGIPYDCVHPEDLGYFFSFLQNTEKSIATMQSMIYESSYPLPIYLSLWGISQQSLETAVSISIDLTSNGTVVQKICALYLATKMRIATFQAAIAAPIFANLNEEIDTRILSLAITCLDNIQDIFVVNSKGIFPTLHQTKTLFITSNNLRMFLLSLQKTMNMLGANTNGGSEIFIGGNIKVIFSASQIERVISLCNVSLNNIK